jgi:hypothetical protein
MPSKHIVRRSVLKSIPNGEKRSFSFSNCFLATQYPALSPPSNLDFYNGPTFLPYIVKITMHNGGVGFQVVANAWDEDPDIVSGQGYWV